MANDRFSNKGLWVGGFILTICAWVASTSAETRPADDADRIIPGHGKKFANPIRDR